MIITKIKINENRRQVDTKKVKELSESIKELGLLNPITVNTDGTLIAGMHRLEACKLLGHQVIEVNEVDLKGLLAELAEIDENLIRNELFWTDADKQTARRKAIYLELYPDTEKGKISGNQYTGQKRESDKMSFTQDTSKKTGKSERTVERSVKRGNEITEEEAEVLKEIEAPKSYGDALIKQTPEIRKKVIDNLKDKEDSGTKYKSITSIIKEEKKKEIIEDRIETKKELPKNFDLFNDDCLNILKTLEDNSIDCVLTDPPYAIDFNHSWQGSTIQNDDSETALYLLEEVCKTLVSKCKEDAHIYIFTGWIKIAEFKTIIQYYFDISNILVWVKNNTSLVDFDKRYAFKYENIFFCKQKGNNNRILLNKQSPDVLNFDRVNSPNHPTEKPVELLEYIIKNSTVENELILDCFMGSGSTGVAAKNTNRNFIGVELDKKHFDYATARMAR